MRLFVGFVLVATLFLFASCTPPEPPPTYTIFFDDGMLVFSGTESDVRIPGGEFSIPENAQRAYVVSVDTSFRRGFGDTNATWEHVDPGEVLTLNGSYFVRIVFDWNGSLPNVTWRETEVRIANVDSVVRASTPKSRVVTYAPRIDLEAFLLSVSGDPRNPELEGETASLLVRTGSQRIGLHTATSRWHLIRPAEYLLFVFAVTSMVALSVLPALFASKLHTRRFLLWGPLAFGAVGAAYQILAIVVLGQDVFEHVFGVELFWLAVCGWFVGFVIGPVITVRRFGTKVGLLSLLLSVLWVPVMLLVFGLLFIAFMNLRALF